MDREGSQGPTLAWVCACLTLSLAGCSAPSDGPTAPSAASPAGAGLSLFCPESLLTGETAVCSASARTAAGHTVLLWAPGAAVWSVVPPGVVEVDDHGRVTGRSGGTATVQVSYDGMTAAASLLVRAEDGLRVAGGASQGGPTPGTTAWMALSGYYSVASADAGHLRVEVRDQHGVAIGVQQQTVTRGGGAFNLAPTYSAPDGTTEVCAVAVLQVGGRSIEAPPNGDTQRFCIRARP